MYNICTWFILFRIHMYTKEYIQGGSTSVQRHPLLFRGSTSYRRHPLETFKINVFACLHKQKCFLLCTRLQRTSRMRIQRWTWSHIWPRLSFMSQRPSPPGVPEAGASFCVWFSSLPPEQKLHGGAGGSVGEVPGADVGGVCEAIYKTSRRC